MIVSRYLKEGMTLLRGKENLSIKKLIKTGNRCTAVVINGKGEEEKLSISDMWAQKVTMADSKTKELPKEAKEKKAPIDKGAPIRTHEVKRANGIATTFYAKDGSILSSAWKRTH